MNKIRTFLVVFLILLLSVTAGYSIAKGSYAVLFILTIAILFALILSHNGVEKLLLLLVCTYWMPVVKWLTPAAATYDMYLFEIGMYILLALLILGPLKRELVAVFAHRKMFVVGCFFFLMGALIANMSTSVSGALIARLRANVFLPMVMFVVFELSIRSYRQLRKLTLAYALTTGLIALALFLAWRFGSPMSSNSSLGGTRLGFILNIPIFNNYLEFEPTTLATTFAISMPFVLGLAIDEDSTLKRILLLLSFCAISVLLVFTQGRAGWIAGAGGCLLVIVLNARRLAKKWLVFVGLGASAGLAVFIFRPLWDQQYSNANLAQRLYLLGTPAQDPNYIFRINQFSQRWGLILRSPLGISLTDMYTPTYYVHSMYLFLALGVGLIGLLGYLLMISAGLLTQLSVLRNATDKKSYLYASIGLSCILAWMVGGLTEPVGLLLTGSTLLIWLSYLLSYKGASLATELVTSKARASKFISKPLDMAEVTGGNG